MLLPIPEPAPVMIATLSLSRKQTFTVDVLAMRGFSVIVILEHRGERREVRAIRGPLSGLPSLPDDHQPLRIRSGLTAELF